MAVWFEKGAHLNSRSKPRFPASRLKALVLLTFLSTLTPASAELERTAIDLELILAVDVSNSMSEKEQRLQRDGYVSAFQHPDVAAAIESGHYGAIAVLYMEWAGPSYQRIVVQWTRIDGLEGAKKFAENLATKPIQREAGTSISAGLLRAAGLFLPRTGIVHRQVIDVSGDGPNNAGPALESVRDHLVASGVSINGLPIAMRSDRGTFETFHEDFWCTIMSDVSSEDQIPSLSE
jgi:hypothetical protein